jgi:hypothetical protein
MPGHETVVIFECYDALAVFEAALGALPPRQQSDFDRVWRPQVTNDAAALRPALLDMLEGPFRTKPILLVVDDLERILETPQRDETARPVKTAYTAPLAAIIAAFRDAETESRLLLTSRYTFDLTDGRGDDLAARLVAVQLPPMDAVQRDKQMRAAARLAGAADLRADPESRIKNAAGGNPGLQAVLSRPLLAGEIEAAERAVAAVERYLDSGDVPQDAGDAAEFFERVSLTAFRDMLTVGETEQLRAATLFLLPVPPPVLAAAGRAASVAAPERAIERLQGLGLVDLYPTSGNAEEVAINPLARPLVPALTEAEAARLAEAAIGPLYVCWKDAKITLWANRRALRAARLAVLGNAAPEIVNDTAYVGAGLLTFGALDPQGGLDLVLRALDVLDRTGAVPDLHVLRRGAELAGRLGRGDIEEMLLDRGLRTENADPRARAILLVTKASRNIRTRTFDAAEKLLREAEATFASLGEARDRADAMLVFADMLFERHQLDPALKILKDEVLPVYERLGEARERAVAMGGSAGVLAMQGRLDDEELVAVAKQVEALRLRALTMGRIAGIFAMQGKLDEALMIRNEELPVYERLGDVRDHAVTMGRIADILWEQEKLDEALKIRYELELPVYVRLGAVREQAVAIGKIADILADQGKLDEALEIRREQELTIYERLGEEREHAVAMGKIAEILAKQDKLEEAFGLWRGEALPALERLSDLRELAVGRANFAVALWARGRARDRDEARQLLRLALDEARRLQLPELQQIERAFVATAAAVRGAPPPRIEATPLPPPPARGPVTRGIPGGPASAPQPSPATDKAEYTVWYGTNRRPNNPADPTRGYSAMRDGVVHYGSCRVFIPRSHKIGSTGSPWLKRVPWTRDDRLRLRRVLELARDAYWRGVAAQLAAVEAAERNAVIFVHGYNVTFADAALRAAQIGFDLSVKGAMAFFSWPSQGSKGSYSADEATIEASEGAIADFMTDFAEHSGAAAVHIIAHSMGNRGVLRAVDRIAAAVQRRSGKPFGQIILAAAELYVSKRDRAVDASRWLHASPRAGLVPPTLVVPGIDTVNVTDVDMTVGDAPPDQRFGLRPTTNEAGDPCWLIGG